ncbi:MAG: rod shape-determining protein RodA [Acidobacteriota bacterium]|jgi:rod shape determining protein RodA|nr:rod shape-determining protein RodA [Acidobacteriota bacterium]
MIKPDERLMRSFDWLWFLALLALSGSGVLAIWSTTSSVGIDSYFGKQLAYLACGIIAFAVLTAIDYRVFSDWIAVLYGAGAVALILVLLVGHSVHGNKSWLSLGPLSIQPSEFMKVLVLVALAKYYANLDMDHLNLKELAIGALVVFVPAALVFLQGDTGTTLTYLPIYAVLSCLAGIRRKHVVALLLLVLVSAPAAWFFVLKDYQKERVVTIFNPERDAKGVGYQTIQSEIAIGSGRGMGKGLKQGSQGSLGFLPARHTDFVFAVLAEELGFVCSIAILLLFLFVLYRLYLAGGEVRDKVGALIVSGVAALVLFHVVINIGMVVGLFPVVGVPLPFVSAGGSSLIACFMAMGLCMSVRIRRYVN